ncbi:MAG: hypothetical protein E7084_03335 [Bacteroidales bacterium]|nr:hypothetical protein [Bacteroidales bacterium]MBP3670997.1 hypothetical protein [Bacteroidaceae bacterium]
MEKKNNEGIRINKYISDYGFCSRREADKLIEDERVTINNRLATPGDRVTENDNIRIDGEHLAYVPREARPKKHRWGPPRTTDSTEEQATRRSGQRGSVRNAKPQRKPSTASSATNQSKNGQSKKSVKKTSPKRK